VRGVLPFRSQLVSRASASAASVGAVMLAVPVIITPAAWPATLVGALALVLAMTGRWPATGTLAALAALATSGVGIVVGTMPLLLAAASGTLVLAYLFALDAVESGLTGGIPQWARGRLTVLAVGFAAALVTAAAATATVPASPWLVLSGVAAIGAALLVAAV
jgi:hypothetical protein